MTQVKFILLTFLCFFLIGKAETVNAQTNNTQQEIKASSLSKKDLRKQTPKYYGITFGFNSSNFRDFASSPLFYKGVGLHISLAHLKISNKKETELGISYDFGFNSSSFNNNTNNSKIQRIELNYSKLYRLNLLKSESLKLKVGFLLTGNSDFRINQALQNNSVGIDAFANLLGSIKITKDISRKVEKEKRFLFWKYKAHKNKQNLSFRLNIGLINSSFRNGYAYTNHSSVLNKYNIFDDYQFKIFSGFKASSSLEYTRYLKNKNAIRISYAWDAYTTGGDLDKFEIAFHTFKFTFLFNTNNR